LEKKNVGYFGTNFLLFFYTPSSSV
jgi:hypothetical protein